MTRFKNRYRIESTRIQHWDYSRAGIYFITIMVGERRCVLGSIENNQFHYSPIGAVAFTLWQEIQYHFTNVELDAFVVMPNHVHGLIVIPTDSNGTEPHPTGKERFQNQGKGTISAIIGSYKSAVSKYVHRMGYEFSWQSRFHDHLVRNENELGMIREYILYNPYNWRDDCYYCD